MPIPPFNEIKAPALAFFADGKPRSCDCVRRSPPLAELGRQVHHPVDPTESD
jgi:hypothetical protein